MAEKRYYIAGDEARCKIAELMDRKVAAMAECRRLAQEVGADEHATVTNFDIHLHGFRFFDESKADAKVLRKDKHGWWVPRRTKAGRPLEQRMRSIRIPGGATVGEALGLNCFLPSCRWVTPGVQQLRDGRYLLTVDAESGEPAGCERISDIEAERLLVSETVETAGETTP